MAGVAPLAAVPFGRIVNNTIWGGSSNGTGIEVRDNTAPTILNNLFANLSGSQELLTPLGLQYVGFLGCLVGTLVGVLPGIGPLAGISLLLPMTFGLDATRALVMLAGIYYGAMYGGSTTSDRKSTRLNSSHMSESRMPSSA